MYLLFFSSMPCCYFFAKAWPRRGDDCPLSLTLDALPWRFPSSLPAASQSGLNIPCPSPSPRQARRVLVSPVTIKIIH